MTHNGDYVLILSDLLKQDTPLAVNYARRSPILEYHLTLPSFVIYAWLQNAFFSG